MILNVTNINELNLMKKHSWNSLFDSIQEMGCLGKGQLYSLRDIIIQIYLTTECCDWPVRSEY